MAEYKLSEYDASVISADKYLALYFENTVKQYHMPKIICNWLMGDVMNFINTNQVNIKKLDEVLPVKNLVAMVQLIDNNTISGKIAKEVLAAMLTGGKDAATIIKEKNLGQISDSEALEAIIDEVIREQQKVVEEVKTGKDKALMFLVGQVMQKTRGKANPQIVNTLIKKKLLGNA
jgi:aspartyl/glutamyl-tRNA(Asn/Gln) amidotransferase subunit B (EC 6.3.5.-)